MSRIDGPESDGAGSDEQALIGKGKRPLQHPCWGWSRYALCSGDPSTSNLIHSIIKNVDFGKNHLSAKIIVEQTRRATVARNVKRRRRVTPQVTGVVHVT
jgi:hypothetical protein